MSKFKTVIAVGKRYITTSAGRGTFQVTQHWKCTLECGHTRLQSALQHYQHSDKLKCKVCPC